MRDTTRAKDYVARWIGENKGEFHGVSDAIFSYAELGMEEFESTRAIVDCLRRHGFAVEEGVAQMPTAFVASYGSGRPVIALSCECDALPGLSQEPGQTEHRPVVEGAPGHGCGHNLLGVAEVMAAVAIKNAMGDLNLEGTIKVFGTPLEEMCTGKPYMARAGVFDGVQAVLDWHPWYYNLATYDTCNAYFNVKCHFRGRTAHGNAPWHGRSALDAAMLMGHMIEMLREHIAPGNPPDAANTINYTFPDVGPEYASVVPDRATLWCIARMISTDEAQYVLQRVTTCAEAAAMATETSVERELVTATHHKIPNKTLAEVIRRNLDEVGLAPYSEQEQRFARELQRGVGAPETGISTGLLPFEPASTALCDTSEYSWIAPYATFWLATAPGGIGWHNWRITSCVGSSIGKKSMDTAATVLARSGVELLMQPEVFEQARAELDDQLGGGRYESLIPEEVKPPVQVNRATMDKYRARQREHYKSL
ncbi:MAG: amidohydrolase [Chloroflexota bacterium]